MLHRTIAAVGADMGDLAFNTAVARLFELNNRLIQVVAETGEAPEEVVEPLVLMTAPLAPHVAEELWERLGHERTLAYEEFPQADEQWLRVETVEIAVQVNGKVRARLHRAGGARRGCDGGGRTGGRAGGRVARGTDGAQGRRRARPAGQLRRGLRITAMRGRRLSPEAVAAFVHVPEVDRMRARVVIVPWLTPGVAAMTLGAWILVRRGASTDLGLVAHELVHVEQWRERGAPRFLARYLGDYLRLRLAGERSLARVRRDLVRAGGPRPQRRLTPVVPTLRLLGTLNHIRCG